MSPSEKNTSGKHHNDDSVVASQSGGTQAQSEKLATLEINHGQDKGQTQNTSTPTTSPSSSIDITTRSDLSLLYRVLRTLIRPLRPNLVRPGKPFPAGSPRLSPPNKQGVNIVESCSEGVWQYTFQPKNSTSTSKEDKLEHDGARKHQIYYFVGGGFQSPPSSQHWQFLTTLSKHLSSSTSHDEPQNIKNNNRYTPEVTLISYPLAPNSPASQSYPILQKWLSATLHSADLTSDKITLMGDSSGGNIALSLGFWAVENHIPASSQPDPSGHAAAIPHSDKRTGFPLVSLLAISPAVDLRNVNPEMHGADRHDPILTVELTSRVARAWASEPSRSRHLLDMPDGPRPHLVTDAQLSPLLNTEVAFDALRRKGVSVHGVVGTHDVLGPDALLFMRKCEACGVNGKWLVWDGQMHCFPLAAGKGPLGLSEAKAAMTWIEHVVRSHEF
ncbi:hypothetical protein LTR84_009454 [Exophiala bonariae]|uniref:Alpha/beta hydrolase fold-3 domain-containing protein n=1 Tax=Exophiala bonariae TaxID=1690606 RepID=A0AAV9MWZ7_9EURO|nr:hypothetical protein LTR84_009454 [Exophiala bonariae]